jgi:uncharacterized membrane protein
VDPVVFALVASSAVIHVAWNVVLKTARDPLRAAVTGIGAATLVIGPIAALGWLVGGRPALPVEVLLIATVSGAIEAFYFVLLAAAYRRGDLSVVYPLARGSAPVFAVVIGLVVLGERLRPGGLVGVAVLIAGLVWLQRPWRIVAVLRASSVRPLPPADGVSGPAPSPHAGRRAAIAGSAVPYAIATGLMIACYSALDRVGVRLVEPWLYAGLIWPAMAVWLWLILLARRRLAPGWGTASDDGRPDQSWRAVAGGLMTLVTYFLILTALRIAPLSAVSPLRESAVVLASGWGALGMRETASRRLALERIGASALVLVGAVLLGLAG